MQRRWFLIGGAVSVVAAGLGWLAVRLARQDPFAEGNGFDRVVFVCTNGADYSPGVYVHGHLGGSPALRTARDAVPFMRAAEVGDAAAGLCGYLHQRSGGGASRGLSLFDAPRPSADGVIDWQAYAGWNVDVVLINLRQASAECYSSEGPPGAGPKLPVGRIEGLALGRE